MRLPARYQPDVSWSGREAYGGMTEERKKRILSADDKYKSDQVSRKAREERLRLFHDQIYGSKTDQEKIAIVREAYGIRYPENYKFRPRELDRLVREIRILKSAEKLLQNTANKKSREVVVHGRQSLPSHDKDIIRDEPPENNVPLREPAPLQEPDAEERLALENINHRTLAAHVAQLEATDPGFAAELKAARTAQHAFGEAAKPLMPLPTVAPPSLADANSAASQSGSVSHPDAWGPHVPAFPPRRWKERDKKNEKDPAKFIREKYAEWLPHLSNSDLLHLDDTLYFRYADWKATVKKLDIGEAEKSKMLVDFGASSRLDDAERGRRARERSRVSKASYRAKKEAECDILS